MPRLCFGKLPRRADYRTLRFEKYLAPTIAAPPPTCDVLTRVYANLGVSDPTKLFPMDGNDTLGDCTIAGVAHSTTVFCGLVGTKKVMDTKTVESVYMQLTGGQDTGLPELDVLNFWRKNGVSGEKILAFARLDTKKHDNIKQAIHLFGGVYLGFQVQQNCIQEFEARTPWTPGPLTNDGHAVFATAYDASGVTVLTWGNTQKATWAWWDECVDEAYAILPMQARDKQFAGFDLTQLQADLSAIAAIPPQALPPSLAAARVK